VRKAMAGLTWGSGSIINKEVTSNVMSLTFSHMDKDMDMNMDAMQSS
jgi:hypothetical protein